MLRDYQLRAIAELRLRYRDRPLLCLPTGAGKTSVAAEMIRAATAKGHRCIFLVHRRELVDQAVSRLKEFGVKAGRILAGYPEARTLSVQVASIPTLLKRAHWPAQLVIVDECSHAVSETWKKCLDRYADSWVIGLTATPIRLDGRGLGDLFGCIIEPVTTEQLIAAGHLVRPDVYAPPVDLKGIKVKMGDYDLPQLADRMGGLVGSLTAHWQRHAQGMRTVAFAVNVQHSEKIVEAFRAIGVRAAHIDGGTAHRRRARTLAALREGKLDLVSNCMVLSEGWDLPALQCAILARPTKSLALFRQMVGRVMRPPGPVLVLDHAGNHHEHGAVTDEIEWSLEGWQKRKRSPSESITTCKACFAVFASGPEFCPRCGEPVTADQVDVPVDAPGELVKLDLSPKRSTLAEKQAEYRNLVRIASGRGYKLGWARGRYREAFGVWPRFRNIERDEYRCKGHEWEERDYGYRHVQRCGRCYAETTA